MTAFNRKYSYPQAIEQAFFESWPGFAQESSSDRSSLTMLMVSAYRQRKFKHTVYKNSMSIYCRVLDQYFGRGRFPALNAKLKLFDVNEKYYHHPQGAETGYTRGYRLTVKAALLIETIPIQAGPLVDTSGNTFKTPAVQGIQALDRRGHPRRGVGNLPAVQVVNVDELLNLQTEAWAWYWHFNDGLPAPSGGRLRARLMGMEEGQGQWLKHHLIAPLNLLMLQANCVAMPRGSVEVVYSEYESGRLYTQGGFLQTAPREIRSAAFAGCFDYDVENCHYSLLSQLAYRCNQFTPAIDDYLLRKPEIRHQLAADLGVSVKTIKGTLIAAIYGASKRANVYYKGTQELKPAILRLMGTPERARALFDHPLFAGLLADISRVKQPVIDSMPKNRGRVVNPFGKALASKDQNEILAHILQGAESAVLHTVIREVGDVLTLLMHDGWVSKERLDVEALSDVIYQQTQFVVVLEESEL